MALRLWNQCSCARYLRHGVFRTYSVRNRFATVLGRQRHAAEESKSSHETGSTAEDSRGSCSSAALQRARGRSIRYAYAPLKPSDMVMRPMAHNQFVRTLRNVARTTMKNTKPTKKRYRLRDSGLHRVDKESYMDTMRRTLAHRSTFESLQPQDLLPFGGSRNMSHYGANFSRGLTSDDVVSVKSGESDVYSQHLDENLRASRSARSLLSARTLDSSESVDFATQMEEAMKPVKRKQFEPAPVEHERPLEPSRSMHSINSGHSINMADTEIITDVPANRVGQTVATPPSSSSSHVGYNFTQYNPTRNYTTFARFSQQPTFVSVMAGCRGSHCGRDPCAGKVKPVDPFKCRKKGRQLKAKLPYKNAHKVSPEDRWTKCECCPEMLPCDQDTCVNIYPFPCICDNPPGMCPIDCPPPCEWPPPPPVPLCRPPQCPVYQKIRQCKPPCPPKPCVYVEKRKLPPIKMGCKCVEPFMPHYKPPLEIKKRKAYQCLPECKPPCPPPGQDEVVEPRRLPPIIPGDCPCIEPPMRDVPPLRRLNLDFYQTQKECKPPCKVKIEQPKCNVRKKLPKIRSDCVCIENPPLKDVPLVRLPPICVCPEPPDPKCAVEECPPRADKICKWKFPKQKLKRYWPDCRIPKSKYKWCRCHTRGSKKCNRPHNRRCMCTLAAMPFNAKTLLDTNTCVVRDFSSFSKVNTRGLHTAMPLSQKKKQKNPSGMEKKKCKKPKCPPICGTVCCEPRARDSCEIPLPALCCRVKRSPYPAFSECGEFSELLTCECKHSMPYLQPNKMPPMNTVQFTPPWPITGIIDPTDEEFCVLNDLCRPKGITYTCETFHQGEPIPLTQYECYSPHRLPCCERDQICDFYARPSERYCDGQKKEREHYRCECWCADKNKCSKKKMNKLSSVYSKIRKNTVRRRYSTMSGNRQFSTQARQNLLLSNNSGIQEPLPSTSAGVPGLQSVAHYSKRPPPRVGGHTECPDECPKCDIGKKCPKLKLMRRRMPAALKEWHQREAAKEMSGDISRKLKDHFTRGEECCPQSSTARRNLLLQKAKCAARRVGMKLVCDHSICCKSKECKIKEINAGGKCGPMPECKRPKNVCCECDPRYEVDECRKKKWVADCCQMPYSMSGAEFRAMQPPCCKMPIPPCNENCMRVRGPDCPKEYIPCCVIEAPFPAFSDCHPPFKRPIHSECLCQLTMQRKSGEMIAKMLNNLKANKKYSTRAGVMPVIEEEGALDVGSKSELAALHDSTTCPCAKCTALRQSNAQIEKMDCQDVIDNIPLGLFTKDDIFRQVDKENLISLAPEVMSSFDKVKSYFFNKANVSYPEVPPVKLPVDGFECFVTPSSTKPKTTATTPLNGAGASRSYSTAKPAKEVAEEDATDSQDEDLKNVLPTDENVIELSTTTDLVYLMDDGQKAFHLRPKPVNAHKVKVDRNPVCTHILLDSGELLLETQYHMMTTIMPMKNRLYLPYGLSHEEYAALEERNMKTAQEIFDKIVKIEGM